jgi:hypothetical protein
MRYLDLEKRRQKMLELRNQLRAQYIFAKRTIVLTPPRSLARSQKLGACAVMEKWYTHHAYGPPLPAPPWIRERGLARQIRVRFSIMTWGLYTAADVLTAIAPTPRQLSRRARATAFITPNLLF